MRLNYTAIEKKNSFGANLTKHLRFAYTAALWNSYFFLNWRKMIYILFTAAIALVNQKRYSSITLG